MVGQFIESALLRLIKSIDWYFAELWVKLSKKQLITLVVFDIWVDGRNEMKIWEQEVWMWADVFDGRHLISMYPGWINIMLNIKEEEKMI